MTVEMHSLVDRASASKIAAERIAAALDAELTSRHRASFVASGGSTPLACYAELATRKLDWSNVTVTLSDERWVAADDPASNAGMLARELFVAEAAAANFVPLYRDGTSASDACDAIATDLRRRLAMPFSATLLGMGSDGHFASLFPDAENLEAGLDLASEQLCVAVATAASPVPRISLTLAALLASQRLVLLVFGDDKRAILERAADGDTTLPVTRLLAQQSRLIEIIWAP